MTMLDRDGVRLSHDERGEGEPTLLFVHGWSGNRHHFDPQVERFAREYRVISVDLRGHGASDAPDETYSLVGFADDLAWVCKRLGADRVVVVGHSMGGSVSLALAARHPELVSAIVLLDSPLIWADDVRSTLGQAAEAMYGPDGLAVRRAIIDAFFIATDDPERRAALTEQMLRTPNHVAASAFTSIATWDHNETAARVEAPVLAILAGTMPLNVSVNFPDGIVDSLTVGQTVGAGHFIQLEVPDQVNAMIERFLGFLNADRTAPSEPSTESSALGDDLIRRLFD